MSPTKLVYMFRHDIEAKWLDGYLRTDPPLLKGICFGCDKDDGITKTASFTQASRQRRSLWLGQLVLALLSASLMLLMVFSLGLAATRSRSAKLCKRSAHPATWGAPYSQRHIVGCH